MLKKFLIFILLVFLFHTSNLPFNVYAATKKVYPDQDTYINQHAQNTTYGDLWYATISNNHPNASKCLLVKFNDVYVPRDSVFENAYLHMYIFDALGASEVLLKVGPNSMTPEFNENTATWHAGPHPDAHDAYVYYPRLNVSHGDNAYKVEVTKIVQAWQNRRLTNNGFYVCMPNATVISTIKVLTKEYATSDGNKKMFLEINYNDHPIDAHPWGELRFELISPDNTTLHAPPYRFTWHDTNATDPAREHLQIVINKKHADGTLELVLKKDIPATWTRFETSKHLSNGDYEWYINAYMMDTRIRTTDKKNFKIGTESATESTTPVAETSESSDANTPTVVPSSASQNQGNQDNGEVNKDLSINHNILYFAIGIIVAFIIVILMNMMRKSKESGSKK